MKLIHVLLVIIFISGGWASTLHDSNDRLSNGSVVKRDGLQDPVELVEVVYPLDNALENPPVTFSAAIHVRHGGTEHFSDIYGGTSVCFEVNNATFGCSSIHKVWSGIQLREVGIFTVRAYLSDVDDEGKPIGKQHWMSRPITFTVIGDDEFATHINGYKLAMESKHRAGYDLSLVDWALQQQSQRPDALLTQLEKENVGAENRGEDLFLLIGVKTAIATNFPLRQAIRETWASKDALFGGVKVIFIGCRPLARINDDSSSKVENDTERRRFRDAIELEKMIYGDFLTDELNCDDLYIDLANKVKEFLHVAAAQYSHAQYVMIADDDLYLRVDELVTDLRGRGSHSRYYGRQVLSIRNVRKDAPTRDKNERYALSEEQYPLSELPPFALGAYFFLSMDCVEFISRNYRHLRDLGGMDDITIALWMLVIQVHPQHYRKLGFLRLEPCNDTFVAFGDLSPLAIREIHVNLMENRAFCHGFERNLWFKSSGHAPANGIYRKLPSFAESLRFDFAVENLENHNSVQIVATISTSTQAGIKMPYTPSQETFSAYSRRVCAESRLRFPSAVSSSSCSEIISLLKSGLGGFYKDLPGKFDFMEVVM